MPEIVGHAVVLECFCAVEFTADGTARVGLCALGYQGRSRVHDVRKCILVESCAGRVEIAVARAIAWALDGFKAEAIVAHVGGELLARKIEQAINGGGEELAATWISMLKGRASISADRIDRPMTPRMKEAASLARRGRADLAIDAALDIE